MGSLYDEYLLILVVCGLYLYSSAHLLSRNEVLVQLTSSGYKARFDLLTGLRFNKKNLCFYPIFTPHLPLWKMSWRIGAHELSVKHPHPDATLPETGFLSVTSAGLAIVLFFLLPYSLLVANSDRILLVSFLLAYLLVFAQIFHLIGSKKKYRLSSGEVVLLCFEWFFSPPFAINALRSISMKNSSEEDVTFFMERADNPKKILDLLEDELFLVDDKDQKYSEILARIEILKKEYV